MPAPIIRRAGDYATHRIQASDTNKFALIADPVAENLPFVAVVEIFDRGGKTPPNSHQAAWEMFYVLEGSGIARCDGHEAAIAAGDTLILPPGSLHEVENTGEGRLYCLTVMVPNEGFAELIRSGPKDSLDAQDKAVLRVG